MCFLDIEPQEHYDMNMLDIIVTDVLYYRIYSILINCDVYTEQANGAKRKNSKAR